jgi:hypothetical protein
MALVYEPDPLLTTESGIIGVFHDSGKVVLSRLGGGVYLLEALVTFTAQQRNTRRALVTGFAVIR